MLDQKYLIEEWKTSILDNEANSSLWVNDKPPSILTSGVRFIDEALQLDPKTFLLIGADTGTGKTQLALQLCKHNASTGKKVLGMFLEAYPRELQDRRKHQLALKHYYQDKQRIPADTRFQQWRNGTSRDAFKKYDYEVVKDLLAEPQMSIITKIGNFDVTALSEVIARAVAEKVQLLVIDHIHYFDYNTDEETRALTEIICEIENMVNRYGIATVLFAQFRKESTFGKAKRFKNKNDFHGTSRLVRSPTDILILTRGGYDPTLNEYTTYMDFQKSRAAQCVGAVGGCRYSMKKQAYMDNYVFGRIFDDEFRTEKPESWAKSAMRGGL